MTEAQAYEMLNWPRAGVPMGFVLPISGSTRTDWIVYECPCAAGYRGLSVPEAFAQPGEMATCPVCKGPWIKLGE
jgi:hypothetical protein